jgi:choline dehydrogenase-like flavoprotein
METFDAIVVGSGMGGSMVADTLVRAGRSVLMLERGDWVQRGAHNWEPGSTLDLSPFCTVREPYRVLAGGHRNYMGFYCCVGGPSVFYGGVAMRFREADFETSPEIERDTGVRWPISYADLEPYYSRAEEKLQVAGEIGRDPTEPYHSYDYPQGPNELSGTSRLVESAALDLGLQPFRLPLAINYSSADGRARCPGCGNCDTFACAVEAKNDPATVIIPNLIRKGLKLRANTVTTCLVVKGTRVVAVECYDISTGCKIRFGAELVIVSAGALGSPLLLLASELQRLNPGGHTVGRYLSRHCASIVYGFFRGDLGTDQFHKQLGVHDFYFGHPTINSPSGKLGSIQQVQSPPLGLMRSRLPWPVAGIIGPANHHMTGLLVLAEDQPRYRNGVAINRNQGSNNGLPELEVTHYYTKRDKAARRALSKRARRILRRAGAWLTCTHNIKTFSHAVGTVRMGSDPTNSALDPFCRFRGVEDLYVVDGSFMPRPSGINPSLTIAANALRCAEYMVS